MVLHVVENLDDYYKQIMNQKWTNKLIICYFTASWCGPCKTLGPQLEEAVNGANGAVTMVKVNVDEKFLTTYYEFPGNFTTNLRVSKQFLQITVGVSTQYDEEVMVNVESHQLALRGIILGVMSEYSEQDVAGRDGKQGLADAIRDALNIFLEDKEGFGGVEGIHFTSFVLQ